MAFEMTLNVALPAIHQMTRAFFPTALTEALSSLCSLVTDRMASLSMVLPRQALPLRVPAAVRLIT
jgi:hypothetical protein